MSKANVLNEGDIFVEDGVYYQVPEGGKATVGEDGKREGDFHEVGREALVAVMARGGVIYIDTDKPE